MMAALVSCAVVGIVTPTEAFAGFSNKAVIAIGVLFIVSAALRSTGALDLVLRWLMGRESTLAGARSSASPCRSRASRPS